ncbi:MAG: MerR family transcriptional regulator [Kineosporiaceae bacterium]
MKIGELSARSGTSVPSIKYYLREGLLPPGVATASNQAEYSAAHLDRLDLIRALREGGELSIATLRQVFAAMDERQTDRPEYLAVAVASLSHPAGRPAPTVEDVAIVDGLMRILGWDVDHGSPGRQDLERAVAAVRRHLPGLVSGPENLVAHAGAMRALADVEIGDDYDPATDPEGALRLAVLGTVLFEPVLLALRKLAHVDRRRAVARRRGSEGD